MDYTVKNLLPEPVEDIHGLIELLLTTKTIIGFEPEFRTWLKVDPNGIFIAVTSRGQVIGSCSGIALSDKHGYVGLHVVKKDSDREQEIGSKLWMEAIRHLGDRNIGFCAPEPTFSMYREKHGFTSLPDWTLTCFIRTGCIAKPESGRIWPGMPSAYVSDAVSGYEVLTPGSYNKSELAPPISTVFVTDDTLTSKVMEYDSKLHKYDKSSALRSTISELGCATRVALKGDAVVGYMCMKPVSSGHWLAGPMYADSYAAAHALFYDILTDKVITSRRKGLMVKFPSANREALRLMEDLSFTQSGTSLHVAYTRYAEDIPVEKIFSIHSEAFCIE